MDTMDNVDSGKYDSNMMIVDGRGWCEKVEGVYRRASAKQYQAKKKVIAESIKQDLIKEMELEGNSKASGIFRIAFDHVGPLGVRAVVSCFRALAEVIKE